MDDYWQRLAETVPTPLGNLPRSVVQQIFGALTPSREGVANTLGALAPSSDWIADSLGAPVDAASWVLHRAGVSIPGGPPIGGRTGALAMPGGPPPGPNARGTWFPAGSVPFSSQYFRNLFADPGITWGELATAAQSPSARFPAGVGYFRGRQ